MENIPILKRIWCPWIQLTFPICGLNLCIGSQVLFRWWKRPTEDWLEENRPGNTGCPSQLISIEGTSDASECVTVYANFKGDYIHGKLRCEKTNNRLKETNHLMAIGYLYIHYETFIIFWQTSWPCTQTCKQTYLFLTKLKV